METGQGQQSADGGAPLQAGRYRLGRVLGAGAMGVVHASYDPALDREVAIKLIAPKDLAVAREPTDPEATRSRIFHTGAGPAVTPTGVDNQRLLEEARALASVAHPNIVLVYDVGVCDAGVFIAMELIDGVPMRAFHEAHPPDWREAVVLHLPAANALAAAHGVGIVHGDFKPDNVLVRSEAASADGRSRVKVVDFGLARAIGRHEPSSPEGGRGITLFGTPAYLAPECWADSNREPSADQFAFFVSLFESIVGRRPWPRSSSLAGLLQRLSAGPELAALDGLAPGRLKRVFARGLDPDPTRRFASMIDVAAELQAVLVVPRRRRTWLAVGGLAVGLAGAAALALSHRGPPPPDAAALAACTSAAQAIDEVWNADARALLSAGLAEAEPAQAGTAARVLPIVDAYASAWKTLREETCRTALAQDPGTAALVPARAQCFEERRTALVGLLETFAEADRGIARDAARWASDLPRVGACDDEAWLMRHAAWPADPAVRERVVATEQLLRRAELLVAAGRSEGALVIVDGALAEANALAWAPLVAEALRIRARALGQLGRYDEGAAELERAYFAAREVDDEGAAAIATERASLLGRLGRFDDALEWVRHAETALASLGGEEGESAARLAVVVSGIHGRRGAFAEALALAERALAIRVREFGEDHHSVGSAELAIGSALAQLDRVDEAQQHFERARAILEHALGPDRIDLAAVEHNLAMASAKLGANEAARAHALRSLELRERWLGPDHPDVATSLIGLANADLGLGRLAEAERGFERALELRERAFGPSHPSLAKTLGDLAQLASKRGDCRAAAAALERALAIAQRTEADDLTHQLEYGLALGDALLACQDREGARAQYRAARALAEAKPEHAAALARADAGIVACAVTAG